MAYTKVHEDWEDLPATTTPVTAAALEQIEQGIADAADDADAAAAAASSADTAVTAHLNDPTDAHDATAISITPIDGVTGTNVQAALEDIKSDIGASGYTPGGTDVAIEDGGTGASTAANARTNLGLAIGTDVQAHSAVLAATTASFLTADETKLDGIEALADVTDAANVAAAGAVMTTGDQTVAGDKTFTDVVAVDQLNTEPALVLMTPDSNDVGWDTTPLGAIEIDWNAVATRNFIAGLHVRTRSDTIDKGRGILVEHQRSRSDGIYVNAVAYDVDPTQGGGCGIGIDVQDATPSSGNSNGIVVEVRSSTSRAMYARSTATAITPTLLELVQQATSPSGSTLKIDLVGDAGHTAILVANTGANENGTALTVTDGNDNASVTMLTEGGWTTIGGSGAPDRQLTIDSGGSTQGNPLMVIGDDNREGIAVYSFGDTTRIPRFVGVHGGGTYGSPSATAAASILALFGGGGYDNSPAAVENKGRIRIEAAEAWTTGAQGCYIGFDTTAAGGTTRTEKFRVGASGNIGINTTDQFGSGAKVIGIANAGTVPSTNPTGGGVLYCEGGALKYRGSSGTVTTLGNA